MLNSWTYGWFGQPAASNQTVQKSQDQSHLQTTQAGRSSQQLNQQDIRPTTRVEIPAGSGWKGNGEEEISTTSADSFKTALDGDGTTLASGHHQVRFEEASALRPVQPSRNEIPKKPHHAPSRPPLPAPTISSNTLSRLKARLSSRSLPPRSPPLQSIPDQPKNRNRAKLFDVWPSPQPQNLPPRPHSFDDRNITETRRYGEAGLSKGDEARVRHRVYKEEWQDNGEPHPHRNEPYLNRRNHHPSDQSFRFPLQLDHSQFDSTHAQLDPTLPHPHPSYSHDSLGLHHPLDFDGPPQFFDHRDSPSFPFPARGPAFPAHDIHSPSARRPSSIDSEATLHEASQFPPNRPISAPRLLTSTIPFSSHSHHIQNPHRVNERGSDRHLEEHRRTAEEWERSVEEEARKRVELEKKLGVFIEGEEPFGEGRSSRGKEKPEHMKRFSENSSRSSRSTSSIGFFPELPLQPEMFLFEGLLLVPPPNFTSLTEIAKLHHAHWIPYHAILTTRTLHFLVNSNPSTQTPILVLDFEHCKSLNKPRELRDREKLFSFVVETENRKKRYFACESGRDWMTWSNKIRELIDLAQGRAPPTLENALDSNQVPPGLLSRPSISHPAAPTSASPETQRSKRHEGNQPRNIDPQRKQRYQGSNEDWMKRFNEDLQVRVFVNEDPKNSCRDGWRCSQPPYPPASPAPRPRQDPPRRLRKPRPRSRSIGITPEELDLARSIFEDLSRKNAANDGEVDETRRRVESIGERIEELRNSIEARIGEGKEDEIAKDWIDRDEQLEYLSAINDTRLKGHRRDASLGQGGFNVSSSQEEEEVLRTIHDELKSMLYDREGHGFDEKRWSRSYEKSPQELLNLFRGQQQHLDESRRFQQDQSGALAALVRNLHANQKILYDRLPKVQQASSILRTINDPSTNLALATDTLGHDEGGRNRSNDIPLSKFLPLENPRKDYRLIPSDGRIADRAIPPSQVHAWRQGDQLNRRGSGNKEGVRFWGVPDPISSSYHKSRLKGGLEAARAAKEIAQFETEKQDFAPPQPYEANTITSRRSTLQRKQKTNHDDELLKRELAEGLKKGFELKAKRDPATQAFAVYEALSKLAEKRNKKGATEKQ